MYFYYYYFIKNEDNNFCNGIEDVSLFLYLVGVGIVRIYGPVNRSNKLNFIYSFKLLIFKLKKLFINIFIYNLIFILKFAITCKNNISQINFMLFLSNIVKGTIFKTINNSTLTNKFINIWDYKQM